MGWQYRVVGAAPPVEEIVAMRLNAIVVDLALLGAPGWGYLERLCTSLPGLGVIVCTGGSTVAQRVRGLRTGADDWVTKPCHPEEVMARIEASAAMASPPRLQSYCRTAFGESFCRPEYSRE